MLKDITKEQQMKCEKCHYRDRTLDKIVFCPYVNNCRVTRKPAGYVIEKGADNNDGDIAKSVHRHDK